MNKVNKIVETIYSIKKQNIKKHQPEYFNKWSDRFETQREASKRVTLFAAAAGNVRRLSATQVEDCSS